MPRFIALDILSGILASYTRRIFCIWSRLQLTFGAQIRFYFDLYKSHSQIGQTHWAIWAFINLMYQNTTGFITSTRQTMYPAAKNSTMWQRQNKTAFLSSLTSSWYHCNIFLIKIQCKDVKLKVFSKRNLWRLFS